MEDQEKNTIFWEQRKKPIKFPKFASSSPRHSKRMEILKQKTKVALEGVRPKLVEMVSLLIIIIALNNRNLSLTNKEKY